MKKFVIAAAMIAASSGSAFAAGNTATANGVASAVVVAPISVNHTGTSLNFGKFTTGAGTIVVTQGGSASATGGVVLVSGITPTADQFTVTGDSGRNFSITTTNGTVASGGVTIPFTTSAPATGALTGGTTTFNVGGTLSPVGTEAAGTYSGSYSVTVTYQ